MVSAQYEVEEPGPDGGRPGPALGLLEGTGVTAPPAGANTRLATASLAAGLCGFSVVTILPGLVLGLLGLRRGQRGRARCWLGISSSLAWAALGAYLLPHLLQAADPGCTAYKGSGLTAYSKVIADFNAAGPRAGLTRDLGETISSFRVAAARSDSPATARALGGLAADLQAVLTSIRHRTGVPQQELARLNQAATRADRACGTLGA